MGARLASTLQELTQQIHALAQGKPLLSNRHADRESADMANATETPNFAEAENALKGARRRATQSLLGKLERAMAVVIEAARTLPSPAPRGKPGPAAADAGQIDVRAGLAALLVLIRNNNLKALAQFHALHAAIEQSDREAALALAQAIETLDFSAAERLVLDQLKREENK